MQYRLAVELEKWGSNADLESKVDSILHHPDEFFGDDNLCDIFGQPPIPKLNFKKWMEEGKFLVRMLDPSTDRYHPYDNSPLTKRHAQMIWPTLERS